jgi:hypothetical protein
MADRDTKGRFSKTKADEVPEEGFWEKPPSAKFIIIAILIILVAFSFPHEQARRTTCLSFCFPDDFGGRGNSSHHHNPSHAGVSGASHVSPASSDGKNRTGI